MFYQYVSRGYPAILSLTIPKNEKAPKNLLGVPCQGKNKRATLGPQALMVCCASRLNPQKIADQAIFYPTNCVRSPFVVVFAAQSGAKTYKCNRLLATS
jgi:hypothetical protein